jgi:hypothetical protein
MPVLSGPEMAHRMLLHDAGEEKIPILLVSGREMTLGRLCSRSLIERSASGARQRLPELFMSFGHHRSRWSLLRALPPSFLARFLAYMTASASTSSSSTVRVESGSTHTLPTLNDSL